MLVGPSILEVVDTRAAAVVLVDAAGNPIYGFNPSIPATGTFSNVPSANTNTVLLAANAARKGAFIYNASTKTLRVALGFNATVSNYSFVLAANTGQDVNFNGPINGIWDAVNGSAKVTEITA